CFLLKAEDGIGDWSVTGVQTCALPICRNLPSAMASSRSRRLRSSTPTRSASSCPTRTARTRACSRSRTTTSSGSRCATTSPRRLRATSPRISTSCPSPIAAIASTGCPAPGSRGLSRQYMQSDADTVVSASPAADAEICMMAADTMEKLGIPRGSYVVKVNNRKILDGVLEATRLGGESNAGRRLTVLRAIDKWDRLGEEGVRLLLGAGRKDESGDFTEGAKLEPDQIKLVVDFVRAQHFLPLEDVTGGANPQGGTHGRPLPFYSFEGAPAGTFRVNNGITIEN